MSAMNTPHEATVVLSIDGDITVEGDLLYSTVSSISEESTELLKNHKTSAVDIDMSKVEKIDSAGIALLLGWKRICDANNKKIQLKNISDQSLSLIRTNKLEQILSLS